MFDLRIENLISSKYFIEKCDYSFGVLTHPNMFPIKEANNTNLEFLDLCNTSNKPLISLFIDNVRLYNRTYIRFTNMESPEIYPDDYKYNSKEVFNNARNERIKQVERFKNHNLLKLCATLPDKDFIIFTGLEDMSLDEEIFDKIPENVLAIFAANSIFFGEKVIPIPFGLSMVFNKQSVIDCVNLDIKPKKLMYINHSLGSTPERYKINDFFNDKKWVSIGLPISHEYHDCYNYLIKIKEHKFMICAEGNAIGCDCYRCWETLYMKRVPIIKDSKFMRKLFEGFPVLFINDFYEITEELLIENDFLYNEAINLDMSKLNADFFYNNLINSLNL